MLKPINTEEPNIYNGKIYINVVKEKKEVKIFITDT